MTHGRKIVWPMITVGAAVSLFGTLLLTERLNHRIVLHPFQLWPLFFLVVGATIISGNGKGDELRSGLVVLAVGIWFLINTLGFGGLYFGESWPLLLILIGLAITFAPGRGRRICCSPPGPILIVWGALAWVAVHQLWGLTWSTVWPLVVVAVGLSIVWRALFEQRARTSPQSTENDDVEQTV